MCTAEKGGGAYFREDTVPVLCMLACMHAFIFGNVNVYRTSILAQNIFVDIAVSAHINVTNHGNIDISYKNTIVSTKTCLQFLKMSLFKLCTCYDDIMNIFQTDKNLLQSVSYYSHWIDPSCLAVLVYVCKNL